MPRNVTGISVFGLFLSSFTGCSVESTHVEEAGWTQTVICIDHSKSMRLHQREELADVGKVFRAMTGAGETEVCIIDSNPLSSSPLASVRVRPFDPDRETWDFYTLDIRDALKRDVPRALNELESALSSIRFSDSTAIIDSLEVAARSFQTVSAAPARKRLVIISDMIEDANGIQLDRERLTPQRRRELVGRLKAERRLPDLSDVEVFISGARVQAEISRTQADGIETFWLELFDATGARIHKGTFMPTLRESLLSERP